MTEQLWVFAGPNGAGKSTLVGLRVRGRIPIVNPDDIARTLPQDAKTVLRAGQIALRQREEHLAAGRAFGIETTLTGHAELRLMRQARTVGYKVNLVFVGVDDAQLSAARVHARVGQGGHDVPLADVLRRFDRSIDNLSAALAIAHRAFVLDNSGPRYRLLFAREDDRIKHVAPSLPRWAEKAIPAALRQRHGRTLGP